MKDSINNIEPRKHQLERAGSLIFAENGALDGALYDLTLML